MDLRAALEHVEASGPSAADAAAAVAFAVSLSLRLDEAALAGPLRRALLLLATGGDPHRTLDVDGRAVRALAGDLEALVGDDELAAAVAFVDTRARGLPSDRGRGGRPGGRSRAGSERGRARPPRR